MNTNSNSNCANSIDKNNCLPWDLFKNWLYCICVVTFDLELGQAMEVGVIYKILNLYLNYRN